MRQFESLRRVLAVELGVGPDPETVRLYEEVLAQEGPQPTTPEERAAVHLAAGLVAMNRMDLDEAEREARAARTLAVEAGLGRELGQASGLLGMAAHARGGGGPSSSGSSWRPWRSPRTWRASSSRRI